MSYDRIDGRSYFTLESIIVERDNRTLKLTNNIEGSLYYAVHVVTRQPFGYSFRILQMWIFSRKIEIKRKWKKQFNEKMRENDN